MTEPKRTAPALSGWCLCRDHERCAWSGCHCSCHVIGADFVELQGDSWDNEDGNDERPPAVTEDRSSHSDSHTRKEGVGSW